MEIKEFAVWCFGHQLLIAMHIAEYAAGLQIILLSSVVGLSVD